ncbi:SpaN/EivJ family type III secretion system needle length determinant [Izhakiella capsodis]|nr:hypothetical protein [Izhakiella capsodis]
MQLDKYHAANSGLHKNEDKVEKQSILISDAIFCASTRTSLSDKGNHLHHQSILLMTKNTVSTNHNRVIKHASAMNYKVKPEHATAGGSNAVPEHRATAAASNAVPEHAIARGSDAVPGHRATAAASNAVPEHAIPRRGNAASEHVTAGGNNTSPEPAEARGSNAVTAAGYNATAEHISAEKPKAITPSEFAALNGKIVLPQAKNQASRQSYDKEVVGEAAVGFQTGTKLQTFSSHMNENDRAKSKNDSTTLQKLKVQIYSTRPTVKPDSERKTLEVDYVFQRWSGSPSVKVSVPTQPLHDANITLLPSDTHAADILLRNMDHLKGPVPELLPPRMAGDEKQQQNQQQNHPQQDEEIE